MTDSSEGCVESKKELGLPLIPQQEDLQQVLSTSPTTSSMANTDNSATELKMSSPKNYEAVVSSASTGRNMCVFENCNFLPTKRQTNKNFAA